jgi:hypothetical protein
MPRERFGWRGLEDYMEVVAHDDKSAYAPAAKNRGSTQVFLEPVTIGVVAHDLLPAVTARHDLVDCIVILDP